jgi:hypothetical protein
MEVCSHMPNALLAVVIWPLCYSLTFFATISDVIHSLQNTFVPIMYDIHVWHIRHHHLLQSLQKPIPTIIVLSLCKSNSQ